MVKRDHAGGPLTLQGWGPSKTCGRRERTCSEEGPREDAVGRQLSPRRGEAFQGPGKDGRRRCIFSALDEPSKPTQQDANTKGVRDQRGGRRSIVCGGQCSLLVDACHASLICLCDFHRFLRGSFVIR